MKTLNHEESRNVPKIPEVGTGLLLSLESFL